MKKTLSLSLVLLCSLCLCTGCARQEEPIEEAPVGVAVQTQTVSTESISTEHKVSGKILSDNEHSINIGANVKCTAVHAHAGDYVEAGDIICTLDLSSTQASYNAASISYRSAVQSYNNQAAVFADQIALLRDSVDDLQSLYQIGAASQIEIDQAQLQLQSTIATRDATLAQLQATMESSKSSMEQLATVLEDVDAQGNVRTPMSGTLATMNAVAGSFIAPNQPVAVINDSASMKVAVSVAETLVYKLAIGDEADISVSSLGQTFPGTIRSVERAANAQTKLYSVTVVVPENIEGLLSGMSADVTFQTDAAHDAVVIPTEAILTEGNTQHVFVVENGAAKYCEITTGIAGDGITEITSGLTAGEELVVVGQAYLSDGAAVRVVSGGESAAAAEE